MGWSLELVNVRFFYRRISVAKYIFYVPADVSKTMFIKFISMIGA